MATIEQLWIYPVKSCGAVAVDSATIVAEGGLAGDREWLVTDVNGNMLWQGDLPLMALVQVGLDADNLVVAAPDGGTVAVPRNHGGARVHARQYTYDFHGVDAGDAAAELLSGWLSQAVRLVRIGEGAHRWPKVNSISVLSLASIEALNARLLERGHAPMTTQRFRPNVLLSNVVPFGEESIPVLRFEGAAVELVQPSIRCELVNISLDNALRERQPLPMIARMSRERDSALKVSMVAPEEPLCVAVCRFSRC